MTEQNHIPKLLDGAEPIYMQGNNVGILCLHGLAATPSEMRWYAEHLNQQGYTAYAPRLAGHGADYRDLQRITWHDWYLSALDGYHVLSQHCDQVFVSGLSMGGLLALLIGAHYPVAGIIAMGVPIKQITNRPRWFINLYKRFQPFQNHADKSDFPRQLRDEQLRRNEPNLGRVRYDTWAVQVALELTTMIELVRDNAQNIQQPTCLIYSKSDKTVSYDHLDAMQNLLAHTPIDTHTLEHSGHIMTQDSECATVFDIATAFIREKITH